MQMHSECHLKIIAAMLFIYPCFLHHFTEEEIVFLIKKFLRIGRKGIIINDLQRSYLAFIGIKILTILFSKSELVKNDAPLSVKRGFKKNDLVRLFAECGIRKLCYKT
jgi:hypothetical protein